MSLDVPGVIRPGVTAAAYEERPRRSPRWWLASALDLLIAAYSLALLVIAVTGGVHMGPVSLTEPAKPVLVLLLAVPLRLTVDDGSWLVTLAWPSIWARLAPTLAVCRPSRAIMDVAFALVITRVASFCVGFLAGLFFTRYRALRFPVPFEREKLVQVLVGWDSGWFLDIASHGYYFNPEGQSSIAFFPLYPMLIRVVAWPFGGTDKAIWTAGILTSYVAFALALLALHRFTERVFGDRETARRTVLYISIFPFSLFFTRVYAESLLLLTTVLAISRAWDGQWWRAGAWGALATLARPNGMLVALPLALLALRGRPPVRALASRLPSLVLTTAGLVVYCAYVYALSGDPLAWLSAQAHWGYSLGHPPWEQLLKMLGRLAKYGFYDYFFVSEMAPFRLFHGVVALSVLALTPAVFKRLGAAMGSFVLLSLLVPLSGNALEGIGRYSAILFPVFMLLGSLKSPRLHEAILVTGALFLALLVALFSTGHPIY